MTLTRVRILWLVLILFGGSWSAVKLTSVFRQETLLVGWGGRFQQNTVEVVEEALAGGLRSVEIDVQVTKDGVPIGLHDPTLDRETTAQGSVQAKVWADFQGITRKNGKRIDRLDAILLSLQSEIERVFLDVRDADPAALVSSFRRGNLASDKITFLLFSDGHQEAYRRVFPSAEIIFKAYRPPSEWSLEELQDLAGRGYDGLGFPMNAELPSKRFLRSLRKCDLKSFAFIVQTRDQLAELERLNVDYAVVTGSPRFFH